MIERTPRLVNGKRLGTYYVFPDGRSLYMVRTSGEKSRALCLKTNSWCIDSLTLREVERRGCQAIGVSHKVGSRTTHYVTNLADFTGPESTTRTFGGVMQRCLKRGLFRVDSSNWAGNIEKRMRLR